MTLPQEVLASLDWFRMRLHAVPRKTWAMALLSLSLLLGGLLASSGVQASQAIASARTALSNPDGGLLPAVRDFQDRYGYLPDRTDLRVVSYSPLPLREPRVVLEDVSHGGVFSVGLRDGLVTTVAAGGFPQALPKVVAENGNTQVPEDPLWRVADWPAQDALPEPTSSSTASVTVARDVRVILPPLDATDTAGVPLVTAKPGTADAASLESSSSSSEATGSLLLGTPSPTQYSVMAMPGVLDSIAKARLISDDWLAMTDELATRTGFQTVATATVTVTYADRPALVSYAQYRLGGRLRTHHLMVVFLTGSDRMVLVASEEDTGSALVASQESSIPVGEGYVPPVSIAGLPLLPSLPGTNPAVPGTALSGPDLLAFARLCGLLLGATGY